MGTEKTVSMSTLLLLVFVSATLGAVLTRLYYVSELSDIQSEKIKVERANDDLVAERVTLRENLDEAQAKAEKYRQAAYSRSASARAWADGDVPSELSERVRRAAESADAAARSSSGRK